MKILLLGCAENSAVCVTLDRLGLSTICADENSVNSLLTENSEILGGI